MLRKSISLAALLFVFQNNNSLAFSWTWLPPFQTKLSDTFAPITEKAKVGLDYLSSTSGHVIDAMKKNPHITACIGWGALFGSAALYSASYNKAQNDQNETQNQAQKIPSNFNIRIHDKIIENIIYNNQYSDITDKQSNNNTNDNKINQNPTASSSNQPIEQSQPQPSDEKHGINLDANILDNSKNLLHVSVDESNKAENPEIPDKEIKNYTFEQWQEQCQKAGNLNWDTIADMIMKCGEATKEGLSQTSWLDNHRLDESFFDAHNDADFKAYVQKLIVPANTEFKIFGDLHGDIESLMKFMKELRDQKILDNDFKIIKDNFYLLFLGDFVDRGDYGIEVLYTLMRLKTTNPTKCLLTRGNHEDADINIKYGFAKELREKFPQDTADRKGWDLTKKIERFYNFLPLALFIGTKDEQGNGHYAQCCHGGIEPGYNPKDLLDFKADSAAEIIATIDRKAHFKGIREKAEPAGYLVNYKKPACYKDDYDFVYSSYKYLSPAAQKRKPFSLLNPPTESDIVQSKHDIHNFFKTIDETESAENIYCNTPEQNLDSIKECGFCWNDISTNPYQILSCKRIDRIKFGRATILGYLANSSSNINKLHVIIRAHQHYGNTLDSMLNDDSTLGMHRSWEQKPTAPSWSNTFNTWITGKSYQINDEKTRVWHGLVATYLVCPKTGKYPTKKIKSKIKTATRELTSIPFAAYGTLKTGLNFPDNWSLQSHIIMNDENNLKKVDTIKIDNIEFKVLNVTTETK